jgi:hypothetical protein
MFSTAYINIVKRKDKPVIATQNALIPSIARKPCRGCRLALLDESEFFSRYIAP